MNKETDKRHTERKVAYRKADTKIGKQTDTERQAGRHTDRRIDR
jgi:hypothetical protein